MKVVATAIPAVKHIQLVKHADSRGFFSETFRKGDAFVMPKGFRGTWRQTEPMLKYYVIAG